MSLPTLVLTWQHNVNNAQSALGSVATDNKTLLLALKNAMLGFGTNPLTVRYSCNSVTAGTAGDGVDRWASIANLVFAAPGTAHSWIVLQMVGGLQICFNCESSANAVLLTIATSTAGFTGGTTTARPTATDEVIELSTNNWSNVSTDVALRWSVQLSTTGTDMHVIVCSLGVVTSLMLFKQPVNTVSGWTSPYYAYAPTAATPTIAALTTYRAAARVSSATASIGMACEATAASGGYGPSDTTFGNIANELSGEWPLWPISIDCSTVGARGRLGTLVDIWMGSSAVASGDSYPATGTTGQFAQFNNLVIPWNGGAVNLS